MVTRIGISGWTYPGWRGVFYPEGLVQRRELEYASRKLNSIEINGSFYSLQRPASYRLWLERTPDDFVFAVKGGRFITHMKKLNDVAGPLANFFASGILRLGPKLGPILWQLPPSLGFDPERLRAFLQLLPRTHAQAAALARGHTAQVAGRAWTEAEHEGAIRHAFEVRHESFMRAEFAELLRESGAALVFADSAGTWPYAEDATADFIYIRLHGAEHLYASGYTDSQLAWWAERIRAWQGGREPGDAQRLAGPPPAGGPRDAYVYFDNDVKVCAPFDAMRLTAQVTAKPRAGQSKAVDRP